MKQCELYKLFFFFQTKVLEFLRINGYILHMHILKGRGKPKRKIKSKKKESISLV